MDSDITIHYEGGLTEEKKRRAKEFLQIASQAQNEVMDLFNFNWDGWLIQQVEIGNITESDVRMIEKAPTHQVFHLAGKNLIKTPNNKIQAIDAYCVQLEKAAIEVTKVLTDTENALRSTRMRELNLKRQLESEWSYRIRNWFKRIFGKGNSNG